MKKLLTTSIVALLVGFLAGMVFTGIMAISTYFFRITSVPLVAIGRLAHTLRRCLFVQMLHEGKKPNAKRNQSH